MGQVETSQTPQKQDRDQDQAQAQREASAQSKPEEHPPVITDYASL